ncbi:MAG: LacI family DNA-binding transcriptional regulator [Alphaproteobacteria bacterium]|nr:LacI family DNA-binding transcriptional regulator [Alphaproteobacteria bacterium]
MVRRHVDIVHVARQAGVSPATVSRAFNHPSLVRADTRARISAVVDELGYIRNRAARSIHGKRSGTIGLIVPTVDNAIFSRLIQSFSDALNLRGFTLLLAAHGYDLGREKDLLRSLLEHRVDGIAEIGLDHENATFALLETRQVPVVALWNHDGESRMSCVGPENRNAGYLAAQHLVDLGHRRIGLLFPPTRGNDRAASRLEGAEALLGERGIQVPERWRIEAVYSVAAAKRAFVDLVGAGDVPTGLVAGNDVLAQGAVFAAAECAIGVPDRVSVVGIGDFSGSAEMAPSLTTVRLPAADIGEAGAEVLLELVRSERRHPLIRRNLPLELVVRASTAPPPAP